MPLQNRVTPFGEITAQPWRGALMGNRGILHDAQGRLGTARWRHNNWVCCVTEFRGRHRAPMPPPGSPTRYTALFFRDEACALAAGHRPCAECRPSGEFVLTTGSLGKQQGRDISAGNQEQKSRRPE